MTITGSCLCGAIRFEADRLDPKMAHCHCSMCRKFHGAAFATFGEAKTEDFRWTAGEGLIQAYKAPNGTTRRFCANCGTSLTFEPSGGDGGVVEFALGCLDTPIDHKPDAHIFTAFKADWHDISDDLPQHPEGRNS